MAIIDQTILPLKTSRMLMMIDRGICLTTKSLTMFKTMTSCVLVSLLMKSKNGFQVGRLRLSMILISFNPGSHDPNMKRFW